MSACYSKINLRETVHNEGNSDRQQEVNSNDKKYDIKITVLIGYDMLVDQYITI